MTTMGDVADVVGGGTPKTSVPGNFDERDGHPWLTPADLTGYRGKTIARGRRFLTDQGLKTSAAKYMPAGSVLFSSRAPIGYVAIAANPITTNQGFRSFVPSERLDSDYAYHYLRSIKELAERMASGTTFNELSGSKAKTLPIPLPPLDEQRRIAAYLDEVDTRRDSIAGRLAAAGKIVDRFRTAVLAAACSGRLTPPDWRDEHADEPPPDLDSAGDRRRSEHRRFVEPAINPHGALEELPDKWRLAPLGLVLADLSYGTSKRCAYDDGGMPVLRIPNVSSGAVSTEDLKFAHLDEREAAALELRSGDLLMVRSNGSVGLVGLTVEVSPAAEGMAYAGYLLRLRLDAGMMIPGFLRLSLAAPSLRRQIEIPARSTSGVHNINSREVRSLGVPIPPLAEQREIVARADAALAAADRTGAAIDAASRALAATSRGALARAFNGELSIA